MSLKKITVFGNASNSVVKTLFVNEGDMNMSLLEFLRKNGIPVAYSCDGNGVCMKCIFNQSLLSCQISVGQYLKEKEGLLIFDYL